MNETVTDSWGDASEVMKRLTGSWSFDRLIAGQGSMQGLATFTPLDPDGLAYREQGRLKLLTGTELEAEREYVFREHGGGFDVFFKETPLRLFHTIELAASDGGAVSGSAIHLCNADRYQSTYTFRSDGGFIVRHVVAGPRKDYTMLTTYRRVV
ncbi:hypothetical protein G8O24_10820 [Bradyrhizobium sp. INPA01-394B]|uniref:DUF6314 domain-containing protein n=1 Tax=Bradyrhizobium campsiandrae TaxID=1729892 RepID=A0ABR7U1D2_9BRAD|nr:DUF6314 family protein [Bradyrhizobium campsiandrae]MBC9877832.1 hypothetical protein [Bradyrhizobium campsiandrae]MBC9977613.1 hypothetical protein [Bradyrhizobium campsiandrae]